MGNRILKIFTLIFMITCLGFAAGARGKNAGDEILLKNNWYISSAEKITGDGAIISSSSYSVKGWYPAFVPSTILGVLVKDSVYKNVFIGDNFKQISASQFEKPWWYRTEFKLTADKNKTIKLHFDGIVYKANIWLNGRLIADSATAKGVFRKFEFDVTGIVKSGSNILAVQVFGPKPGEPSIGFADWNPAPPDQSMGLWRQVKIKMSGPVSISSPFVQSKIELMNYSGAELKISADVVNNKKEKAEGILKGEIGNIKFSKKISLGSNEKKTVIFSSGEYPQLKIKNPRLWWPHDMGKPELYKLNLQYKINEKVSDCCETRFGIREVSDYINQDGFRGYKINGRKFQILGGGWVDDIFINNTTEKLNAQLDYVTQMGLNTIRLEGFWGSDEELYNLCDEKGILMMAGWSCQWENDEYFGKHVDDFGGIETPEDIKLIAQSWEDQIRWLRNHPAIFLWMYGSDRIPRPALEKEYIRILKDNDMTRPVLAAASEKTSEISGRTAVKMRGPYDYVAPVYWWSDKIKGGAFGFNTEIGPGAGVPPIESVKKMIPVNHLWPVDSIWNYHCSILTFNNLKNYNAAIEGRLGAAAGLEDYCKKAQYLNYESARAMYEANKANKYSATGVIHWMLNTAWPKLWWQLFDYYLMPTGGFYGVKKACEPLHIMYNYSDHSIIAMNNTMAPQANLTAEIKVYDFELREIFSKNENVNLNADEAKNILRLPDFNNAAKQYFIDLKLKEGNKTVSSNFYSLSSQPDKLDTANSTWYMTPCKEYMDQTQLNKLEYISLNVTEKFINIKDKVVIETELYNNTDKLAFQVELFVTKGKNGESVLPINWDDNYFSLLPGQKRTIKGSFNKSDLKGKQPFLKVGGWNIK